MNILHTIFLSIIEGLTEFLPVSSTGHLILISHLMNIPQTDFLKTFEIAIQLGSILAMVAVYYKKIVDFKLYPKIIVAFLPTAIFGLVLYKIIKEIFFESPLLVASMLILGGIILILLNKKIDDSQSSVAEIRDLSYKNVFLAGCFQVLAMVPGVSRSGAVIVGGVFNNMNKKMATDFAFLLAIPTMISATGYDLMKSSFTFSSEEIKLLVVGMMISFLVAFVVIKTFLDLVKRFSFAWFGWYRIILGVVFLLVFSIF